MILMKIMVMIIPGMCGLNTKNVKRVLFFVKKMWEIFSDGFYRKMQSMKKQHWQLSFQDQRFTTQVTDPVKDMIILREHKRGLIGDQKA